MKHAKSNIWLVSILCAVCTWVSLVGCAPQNSTSPKRQPEANADSKVAPAPATEAQVGVGKKGHAYGGGMITEPASQYWRAKEKIAFDIQIPHAMNLYKALSGNGQGPKSHEEFMKEIIQAGNVKLPELPQGLVYEYDPQTELLMVVSKATEGEPTEKK